MSPARYAAAALAAFALAGPASAPASANPFAGEVRTAATTFQLGGRDGRTWIVRLSLNEVRPVGGEVTRTFDLSLQPCVQAKTGRVTCAAKTAYRGDVAPGAGGVADDLTSAALRATIAGTVVDVAWDVATPDPGTTAAGAIAEDDGEVSVQHSRAGGVGLARGVVLGPRCTARGSVGGGYLARTDGPPARDTAAPLPRRLPAAISATRGWAPRCV
jgi:hypothetical protein